MMIALTVVQGYFFHVRIVYRSIPQEETGQGVREHFRKCYAQISRCTGNRSWMGE